MAPATNGEGTGFAPHPALDGFQYEIQEGADSIAGWRNSIERIRKSKWMKASLLLYIVGGVLIIVYTVPAGYAYLAAFLMVNDLQSVSGTFPNIFETTGFPSGFCVGILC